MDAEAGAASGTFVGPGTTVGKGPLLVHGPWSASPFRTATLLTPILPTPLAGVRAGAAIAWPGGPDALSEARPRFPGT